jgi:hypothetical protein
MKRIQIAWWALVAPLMASAQGDKPLTQVYDEDKGILVVKPKDEKWTIKKGEGKIFKEAVAIVTHRLEEFAIEVSASYKSENQTFGELKEFGETKLIPSFENDNDGKKIEGRTVRKRAGQEMKFPGAGNPKAWFLDIEIDEKGNKVPLRFWSFIDEKDKNKLVRVTISGSDENYKKFAKELNGVLIQLQTVKIKRK